MQNESKGHTMCILVSNIKHWIREVIEQMYLESTHLERQYKIIMQNESLG